MKNERGSVAINILMVIMVVMICVLGWLLVRTRNGGVGRTEGLDSPTRAVSIQSGNVNRGGRFSDGLPMTADDTTKFELDEFGAGIAQIQVFYIDIDGDGHADRITRTRDENGTDHYSDIYSVELRRGDAFVDVTPPQLQTVQGAECALQRIQFVFKPDFRIIKISRPWRDSWTTPTLAEKTEYAFADGDLYPIQTVPMKVVCDVSELFSSNEN